MIADRWERAGLKAARPVLVVGAAPSRSGGDLSASPAGTGAGSRIALYSGVAEGELAERFDFVNLLEAWPGAADGASDKWDGFPRKSDWALVGQRASLLLADLSERPRRAVIVLGEWAHEALRHWWELPASELLEGRAGPSGCVLYRTPHPSGTNMWWNDGGNRRRGREFWVGAADLGLSLPRPPRKVKAPERSGWLIRLAESLTEDLAWPDACVDWPWVDPVGQRPQAYYRGAAVPAAHVSLEVSGQPRPSKDRQALHSCDRGGNCVNAAHLRWGTELENRLDQSARARGDIGRVGLDKAREVRAALESLSAEHGVPMDAIQRIAGGKTWSDGSWTEETDDAP